MAGIEPRLSKQSITPSPRGSRSNNLFLFFRKVWNRPTVVRFDCGQQNASRARRGGRRRSLALVGTKKIYSNCFFVVGDFQRPFAAKTKIFPGFVDDLRLTRFTSAWILFFWVRSSKKIQHEEGKIIMIVVLPHNELNPTLSGLLFWVMWLVAKSEVFFRNC